MCSKSNSKYRRDLDDQAKIYSLSRNKYDTSIFMLSVTLKERIDKNILEEAVELALQKYKAFKVKMVSGFFWYYLTENTNKPVITEAKDYPFKKLNTKENNYYLFKVTYTNNKINIEFFHPLTDGNGGRQFFNEIINYYLELKFSNSKIKIDKSEIIIDSENAYINNYNKRAVKAKNDSKGYTLEGKKLPQNVVGLTHFNIKVSDLKKYAKDNNCTLSVLLIAMLAHSIYYANYNKSKSARPLNICIPIDLRNYCTTTTISNFVSYIVASLKLNRKKDYSLNDFLSMVSKEFETKLQKEHIIATMSSNGKLLNNLFVKNVPLPFKRIMVLVGTIFFKKTFSVTFSNIGIYKNESKYSDHIEDYNFILTPDWAEKLRCGIVSYQDNLAITFGTNLEDPCIEKEFAILLDKLNFTYNIKDNGVHSIK